MKSKKKMAYLGIGLAMLLLAFVLWLKGKELMSNNEENTPGRYGVEMSENTDKTSMNEEVSAEEPENADSENGSKAADNEDTENFDAEEIVIAESVKHSSEILNEEPQENSGEVFKEESEEDSEEHLSNYDAIDKNRETKINIIEKIGTQLPNTEAYRYKISIDVMDFKKAKNDLSEEEKDFLPSNGYILVSTNYEVVSRDTAISLLKKACRDYGIELVLDDAENKVKSIGEVGGFISDDAFSWKYSVNGEVENNNASEYMLKQGDILRWFYSGE